MLHLVFNAVVTGFLLSILIGPVFFVLLETSIKKGVRAALAFDFGVLLSDCVYITIAYFFFSTVQRLMNGSDLYLIKIIGGTLFIAYGIVNFVKKAHIDMKDAKGKQIKDANDYGLLALKGFLLNFANPLVVFYWFSVMTLPDPAPDGSGEMSTVRLFTFLGVILITFFGLDVLKIVGAKRLRPLVTDSLLKGLNRLIGIVFVGFGVVLIFQGWRGYVPDLKFM